MDIQNKNNGNSLSQGKIDALTDLGSSLRKITPKNSSAPKTSEIPQKKSMKYSDDESIRKIFCEIFGIIGRVNPQNDSFRLIHSKGGSFPIKTGFKSLWDLATYFMNTADKEDKKAAESFFSAKSFSDILREGKTVYREFSCENDSRIGLVVSPEKDGKTLIVLMTDISGRREKLRREIFTEFAERIPVPFIVADSRNNERKLDYANKKALDTLKMSSEVLDENIGKLITCAFGEEFKADSFNSNESFVEKGDGSALRLMVKSSPSGEGKFSVVLEDVGVPEDIKDKLITESRKAKLLSSELQALSFDYDPFTDRLIYSLPGEDEEKEFVGFIAKLGSIRALPMSSAEIVREMTDKLKKTAGCDEAEIKATIGEANGIFKLKAESIADRFGTVKRIVGFVSDIRGSDKDEALFIRDSLLMENRGISLMDYERKRDMLSCNFCCDNGTYLGREYKDFFSNVLGVPFVVGKDKKPFAGVFKKLCKEGGTAKKEFLCSWDGTKTCIYLLDFVSVINDKGETDRIIIKATKKIDNSI